jgi:hypothetical protein
MLQGEHDHAEEAGYGEQAELKILAAAEEAVELQGRLGVGHDEKQEADEDNESTGNRTVLLRYVIDERAGGG